jgi:hypothetical protein
MFTYAMDLIVTATLYLKINLGMISAQINPIEAIESHTKSIIILIILRNRKHF